MRRLDVYTGFNQAGVKDYFSQRGWSVTTITKQEISLVRVTKGAALECGDGRFDQLEGRETYGVRILGGVNAVMALHTGGDEIGLERARDLIKKFGATPGTHSADKGGCGYADLWIEGKLKSAIHPYKLGEEDRGGLRISNWLIDLMHSVGGKHFRLNGNHMEEAVRLNPFRGYTEAAFDGLRFRIDDWFLAGLGIPDEARFFKIAETIELLNPEAAKLEIIVP